MLSDNGNDTNDVLQGLSAFLHYAGLKLALD